jgi:hypothetical protein
MVIVILSFKLRRTSPATTFTMIACAHSCKEALLSEDLYSLALTRVALHMMIDLMKTIACLRGPLLVIPSRLDKEIAALSNVLQLLILVLDKEQYGLPSTSDLIVIVILQAVEAPL